MSFPIGGISTSFTSDDTIFPNAPPMMTPTARSMTLPRIANSLNSCTMLMPHPFRDGFGSGPSRTRRVA